MSVTTRLSLASANWSRAVSLSSLLHQNNKPFSFLRSPPSSPALRLIHSGSFLLGNHNCPLGSGNQCSSVSQQVGGLMESSKEPQELNRSLYSEIEPYNTGFLKVSDIHTLYWEQSGNPSGHPVVFLHGGPGGGTSASNRRFFDPEFYRIILFDQRGAGKSTPHACLEENTTWDLVNDIELLRDHLQISEWQVFGGSWGSTLALAYSQKHPDKVTGIILRGIFLLRKKELDWFYEGGAATIFPDAWEPFRDFIPESERGCFIDAYYKRLTSDDIHTKVMAAKIWTTWELTTAHLIPNEENINKGTDDNFALGRYDVCCPMISAWDLHKAWPEAELKIVPDAGHSANEAGIAAELVEANEKLKNILNGGHI